MEENKKDEQVISELKAEVKFLKEVLASKVDVLGGENVDNVKKDLQDFMEKNNRKEDSLFIRLSQMLDAYKTFQAYNEKAYIENREHRISYLNESLKRDKFEETINAVLEETRENPNTPNYNLGFKDCQNLLKYYYEDDLAEYEKEKFE